MLCYFFFIKILILIKESLLLFILASAAYSSSKKIFQYLINKEVDINQVNLNNGTTALHWAVYGKNLKMVQILVDAGKIFPCKKI